MVLRFSILIALLAIAVATPVFAAPLTWIGGNVDWVDAGAATNWNPNDEPDSNDEAIFNTANVVNLGSNNAVNGLTLSGGIDLFTNEFDLTVDGLVQVVDASTTLFIGGVASEVNADDVTLNNNGTIELRGGTLTLDEEVGTSLVDINVGGNLIGNGTISFADAPGVVTSVLINDGELTALSRGLTILSPPPVGTLEINNVNANARVDLDGAGEAGVVNINRNQTLDLNVGFADFFNGTMNLFHNSTLDFSNAWNSRRECDDQRQQWPCRRRDSQSQHSGRHVYIEGAASRKPAGRSTWSIPTARCTRRNFTMSGGTFYQQGT